jgi:hypothetical protein
MLERAIEVALGAALLGIWKMKECLESGLDYELTYFLNT